MEFFPSSLDNLIDCFARLPGIGRKSAQRLAFFVLRLPKEEAEAFANAILEAKENVRYCNICQNLTDGEICTVCASPRSQ
jgi:recombination protein RecR